MPRNVDVALLRALVQVAETGGISAAARGLNLTQGAVSQQLIRLEALLGCRLLTRDHQGARLTRQGQAVLVTAREMVAMNDRLWSAVSTTREPIRLGAPPDIVSERLTDLLKAFAERAPGSEVSVMSAPSAVLQKALAAGALDLALVQHPLGEDPGERLTLEPLVWIGAEQGRAWRATPVPVSISHQACRFRTIVAAALDASGATWRPVLDDEGFDTTLAAVRADLAITASLKSLVPTGVDIIAQEGLPELPRMATSLVRPQRPASSEIVRLEHVLSAAFRQTAQDA